MNPTYLIDIPAGGSNGTNNLGTTVNSICRMLDGIQGNKTSREDWDVGALGQGHSGVKKVRLGNETRVYGVDKKAQDLSCQGSMVARRKVEGRGRINRHTHK